MTRRSGTLLLLLAAITVGSPVRAADSDQGAANGFTERWFAMSDAAKEAQPHWVTPLMTVSARLEQGYRYDQNWQSRANGVDLTNYGGGKGLQLIPTANTELIIGVAAYQTRTTPQATEHGWADETLLLKYRVLAADEEHGNRIVTSSLGVSLPSGSKAFTNHDAIVTPTIAVGQGWGSRAQGVDIQSTLGVAVPIAHRRTRGMPIAWNTALQAHVFEKLWPEIEANYTHYRDGPNDGHHQLAVTAGVIAGRFAVTPRLRLTVGGGYQKAVSSFRTFEHTWLVTARASF